MREREYLGIKIGGGLTRVLMCTESFVNILKREQLDRQQSN